MEYAERVRARKERDLAGARGACMQPMTLDDVVATFKKWLHLPDPLALYAVLGAIAANMATGDPLWLLVIGPPGGGKTELIQPMKSLPDVVMASTLTEASLLSATPSKDRSRDSSGGLLRQIGSFGILLLKDFTSVLSMNRDSRAAVLAALREVYDGSWTRHVGTDGGKTLHWQGKLGLIAACTSIIDQHHSVIAAMGERFIMYRMGSTDDFELASRALDHQGKEHTMRAELAQSVASFFGGLSIEEYPPDESEKARLIALATLSVRCRSSVERDGYHRDVELIPEPEAPGRLALALARLLSGVTAIGASRDDAWRVVKKVGLDCIPALRLSVIGMLAGAYDDLDTTTVATGVRYPTNTARRALEDLAEHGVVKRQPQGQGKSDLWRLTKWTRDRCAEAEVTFPEMSEDTGEQVFE